jgi:hypothetical protein
LLSHADDFAELPLAANNLSTRKFDHRTTTNVLSKSLSSKFLRINMPFCDHNY